MREIVEVALSYFTCFMIDGDSKLWGNRVNGLGPGFGRSKWCTPSYKLQ